jgi:hypothetical protein
MWGWRGLGGTKLDMGGNVKVISIVYGNITIQDITEHVNKQNYTQDIHLKDHRGVTVLELSLV